MFNQSMSTSIPELIIPDLGNSNINSSSNTNPTICLNMIVCNESNIIARLLTSVLPIIDCYCICDTGSTDNTIEVITQFFKTHHIPGIIFYEPFKNFGYNRTISLQKCTEMSDYILLLDADMQLNIGPTFNKSIIANYDFMYICQGNLNEKYYCNIRIIKNNQPNSYKGVTHEYILLTENYKTHLYINPEILFINDIGDGGCKHNKYTRDIKLLTQGIVEEPNNSRYYFYLANSYNDIADHKTAIDFYIKRINMGGWVEELWYSYYRIGICYLFLKEYDKAIWHWLEAYQVYPKRVENLYLIIYIYIDITNQSHLVLINMFLTIALQIIDNINAELKNKFLFLENNIYTYELYILKILHNTDSTFNPRNYFTKILNNCLEPSRIISIFNKIGSYCNYISSIKSIAFTGMPCFHSCIIPYTNQPLPENITNIKYIINLISTTFDIYTLYIDDNIKHFTTSPNIIQNPHKLYNMLIIDDTFISYKSNALYVGKYNLVEVVRVTPPPSLLNKNISSTNISENIISTINIIQKPNYMYTYLKYNTIIYNWFPLIIGDLDGNILCTQNTPNMFNYITGGINTVLYNNQYWTISQIRVDSVPLKMMHLFIVFDINLQLIKYSDPLLLDNNQFIHCHSLTINLDTIFITYLLDNNIKMSMYNIDIIKTHMNDIV